MDDRQSPPPEKEPETAAEAFARLDDRVAGLDGRIALMARAVEHMAAERLNIEIPDYNPTLEKTNAYLAAIHKRMKAIEDAPALDMTPEDMGARIAASAEAAREADRIAIKEMRELNRQNNTAMNKAVGTLRAKEDQRRHMLYAIGGATLAVSLLWLIYPGWAASIGLQSWQWPERVARRSMGEPTLWDAGIRLMQAGNPEGWQAIVDAADMRQANRDTIAACERAAAKAKEPVRCTIRIGPLAP